MLSSDSETSPKDTRGRGGKKRKTDEEEEEEEEDSDFEIKKTKFRKPVKQRRKSQEEDEKKKKKKEEEGRKKRKTEMVEWVEVFVEEEEKWVCVDVVRGKIHCVADIEARLPPGSAYITAFTPDLRVKDVTLRYVSTWLSAEKKLRCSSEWWEEALRSFRVARTQRDKEEDEEMRKILHLQPLPKTVAEYKNHPLYALQRHLLKFEAIYPPDVSPLGSLRVNQSIPGPAFTTSTPGRRGSKRRCLSEWMRSPTRQ
ncbi:DNA repair protein complementing XP-C cells homolog [Portunus trituberculatus]|uniref:DNA repair protein complementing XP-C cells homolog n=1 Tax=Portunus trituberculatus TaxID=210409 RepID=UPI001E1D0640|nr:DNA repair protein complementing XP-C cells homolog [Portunus trituberculatus]